MHKKIKFFKNELLNMIKLTQFIKKFNGSFGPPYSSTLPMFRDMFFIFQAHHNVLWIISIQVTNYNYCL